MKNLINEFKEFAMKGNVIDMAVAVAIGAAFNNVVNSLVNDIITPLFAALTSDVKFSDLCIVLKDNGTDKITINYGTFIEYIFNFLIIAITIFFVIKVMNRVKKETESIESKIGEQGSNLVNKFTKKK